MCHAHNEKWKQTNNGRNRTAKPKIKSEHWEKRKIKST